MAETPEEYASRAAAWQQQQRDNALRLRALVAEVNDAPRAPFQQHRYFARNPFTQRPKSPEIQQRDALQLRLADRIREEFGDDAVSALRAMNEAEYIPASVPEWYARTGPKYREQMVSPYENVGLLGPGTALGDAMTWLGSTPAVAGSLAEGLAEASDAATAYALAPQGQKPMYGRPTGWAGSLERNVNTFAQPLWSALGISDEVPSHFGDRAATQRQVDQAALAQWANTGRGDAHNQLGIMLEQMHRPPSSEELLEKYQVPRSVSRPVGLVMDTMLDPGTATSKTLKLARAGLPRQAAAVMAGDYALGGLLTGAATYAEMLQKQEEEAARNDTSDPLATDGGLMWMLRR